MLTGNLSQAHAPVEPLGGAAIRALLLMLVVGLVVAGWQAYLPSDEGMPSQEQRSSAPTTLAAAAPTRGADQSRSAASGPAPTLPAANLDPVVSSSSIIPSGSSPEPSPDARLAA